MDAPSLDSAAVVPGDRYLTAEPCGVNCRHRLPAHPRSAAAWLGVHPYSHVFRAPVKGRWLGQGLLELFLREFAFVPSAAGALRSAVVPLLLLQTATSSSSISSSSGGCGGAATLDLRWTLPAYVEELCGGALWLHGREAECRAAGRLYHAALIDAAAQAGRAEAQPGAGDDGDTHDAPLPRVDEDVAPPSTTTAAAGWLAWCRAVQWWVALPTEADAEALLPRVLSLAAARHAMALHHPASAVATRTASSSSHLLPLHQRDVVHHLVWRCEGRMFAYPPLEIVRCDVAAAAASPAASSALLIVNKPPGLPVHPSGSYRMNSVTSILEDVLGGDARTLYRVEEPFASGAVLQQQQQQQQRPYASILHARDGFELLRVWLRRATSPPPPLPPTSAQPRDVDDGVGVSAEDWAVLKNIITRPTDASPSPVDADARRPPKRQRESAAATDEEVVAPVAYRLKTYVVHRLDAATSGVLVFGLTRDTARRTAAAIANKTPRGDRDGVGDDDADEDGDGEDSDDDAAAAVMAGRGGEARASSSCKVYCARVRGRVNLADIARTQHQCVLRTATPAPPRSTRTGAEGAPCAAAAELVVRRPIGCLDHHNSLYWSPDAALADVWRRQRQQQQQRCHASEESASFADPDGAVHRHSSPSRDGSGGGGGRGVRTPAAVAAKHERMRQLTRGGRAAAATSPESTGTTTAARVQLYANTLRTAKTTLRVLHYDPAADETVVRCTLGTGRTHQLRVHLASLGHPIVHDDKYAALEAHMRLLAGTAEAPRVPRACDATVSAFYAGSAGAESQLGDTAARKVSARGCLCPEAIALHAWEYTLAYDDGDVVSVAAPVPSWATCSEDRKP
ncbi:RNA pseudouridylate synthase [Novymonas esmeraldas]|uniref:RNA pseudouridylate synthase n=1 Tax=Novymonas esmeraldas TaxID=1808958 RepID=A0AAW0ES49_9TRYP